MNRFRSLFGRYRLLVAVVSSVGGLLAILAGYYSISGTRVVSDQLAYLMSGGLVGVALVIVGVGLLIVDYFVRLEESIQRAISGETSTFDGVVADSPTVEPDLTDGGGGGVLVLPGANRFHAGSCSMVAKRQGVETIRLDEAVARKLTPCSLCLGASPVSASQIGALR